MKIFITGASGFIGGSVAEHLRDGGHQIVGLVRTSENADSLKRRGIEPLIGGLDDPYVLTQGARMTEGVINAADSDHRGAAEALIAALAGTGKPLIHTSGSSIVVDDAKGEYSSNEIFEDDVPFNVLPHRRGRYEVDCIVRTAGVAQGLRGLVICPTTVYGTGLGIRLDSDQVPKLMAKSRERGAGVYIGKGANIWSNVYVGDLCSLYALALEKGPSGAFFFAENGESTLLGVAETIGTTLGFQGKTEHWDLEAATAELGAWPQIALGTNCRVRSTNAKRLLGWRPNGPSLAQSLSQTGR
ncbi:NAD-dependent epimerase/dehydratase family protein [Caballeronia sp. 15715]|uniref:NAD-dependent epimerase/dehydratase family protein n=1 Tax=Caballeronia sp. 15715 TaxID=3391030 RepID=UPI0039E23C21